MTNKQFALLIKTLNWGFSCIISAIIQASHGPITGNSDWPSTGSVEDDEITQANRAWPL